jgi:hypothetical protein
VLTRKVLLVAMLASTYQYLKNALQTHRPLAAGGDTRFDLRTLKKQVKQVQQPLEDTQGKPRKLSLFGKVAWVSRASKKPQPKPPGKPEAPDLEALELQAKAVCWAALHEHKEALNLLLDRVVTLSRKTELIWQSSQPQKLISGVLSRYCAAFQRSAGRWTLSFGQQVPTSPK